jgi:hypothetical protein
MIGNYSRLASIQPSSGLTGTVGRKTYSVVDLDCGRRNI